MKKSAKNPAAVALGRAGGLKRAANLSPARRHEIAQNAGKARQAKRKAALDKRTA